MEVIFGEGVQHERKHTNTSTHNLSEKMGTFDELKSLT